MHKIKKTILGGYCSLFLLNSMTVEARSITETPPVISYFEYCKEALVNEDYFAHFKRAPGYQVMLEHVNYAQGLEYLEIIKNDYPHLIKFFDKFRTNDLIGDPITFEYGEFGAFSPTTLRYIKIAGDLLSKFGDMSNMHIVEIGGGYGGQCKILAELGAFASYTLIDLPACSAFSKKYLTEGGVENVHFIDNEHLELAASYDLVISNYAFSEIDIGEQQEYLKYVLNDTRNGYLIMNFTSGMFGLTSLSLDELTSILRNNQREVSIEIDYPITNPDNRILTWHTS